MLLHVTERVAALLEETASCSGVPETVRACANGLKGAENIAWDDLKAITDAYRKANPGKPVYLNQLCAHKDIALQAPPPKEKSPELQARLTKLQEELENRRYAEMVADVTENERKADEMRGSILPTSRLQLSFGAHVIVTMFTFWAVTYYGTKYYLSYDELWAGLAGALGLTAGLLLETLLLIIRTNRPEPLEERMPELFDSAKVAEAFAKVREMERASKAAGGQGKGKDGKQAGKQAGGGAGSGAGGGAKAQAHQRRGAVVPRVGAAASEGTSGAESKKAR